MVGRDGWVSPIPSMVSRTWGFRVPEIAAAAPDGYFPRAVPMFRSRNHFRVPTLKLGPVIAAVVVLVLVGGLVALAVIEPRPPLKHFEVPVPSERFAR
jgi:hypothetical protein